MITDSVAKISELSKSYLTKQVAFSKLVIAEKFSKVGSVFLSSILLLTVVLLVALFGGLTFSFWYAETYGKLYVGFLITMGFFAILGLLIFYFRKKIFRNHMVRNVVEVLFDDDETEKTYEKIP